jgi:hypothetical protein
MTLNPVPGTTPHNIAVEGLSMSRALKEKLKPILAPKGYQESQSPFQNA